MAEIKNLKVKAGEKDVIKATEVNALYIIPNEFSEGIKRPFVDEKRLVIEAVNGRWEFKLNDISFFEFDIATEKRFIHVISRAEERLENAKIQ